MHAVNPTWGPTLTIEMIDNGKVNTRDEEPAIAVVRHGASAAESLVRLGRYSDAAVALEVISELLHRVAADRLASSAA
jgi:hypothetical protein